MRLEEHVHVFEIELLGRRDRRGDFGGMMGVVVDDRDPVGDADQVEATANAGERGQGAGGSFDRSVRQPAALSTLCRPGFCLTEPSTRVPSGSSRANRLPTPLAFQDSTRLSAPSTSP